MRSIESLGRYIIRFLEEFGKIASLLYSTIKQIFTHPFDIKGILKQMVEVGINSLPVVLITAAFTGMALALQTYTGFARFGAEAMVGFVVAISMTRELGPVLTAIMIAGRVGAAMAAELSTMRVTEQIDALESLATNPVKYLVVPRFLASLIMVPALTVIAAIVGILGGYFIVVVVFGVSPAVYWHWTWVYTEWKDIYFGLIKAFFFGGCVSLLSCYKGFYSAGGAEGVGKATTSAVVFSIIAILISNYFLSALMFA
ncbi:ABC transporter permease [Thermodesulfovibrionales bacterium]|nr:ABC transporter permease [Thermodesulfovibrionales bacterium]MCL0042395.1 ABC transporter permease [Thermodesulfovibrionales bacterium]